MIDLYRLNLNLLVALDVLLTERSVTLAAKKLFMTQAAMSNNLQQLREIFKDDLLVREKNYMLPTHYATALQPKLREVLEELRTLILAGQRFVPELSQRRFRIEMSDYIAALFLPKLLKSLAEKAPKLKIDILPIKRQARVESPQEGEYDLAICKGQATYPGAIRQLLYTDQGVAVLNSQHPLAQKEALSLEDYLHYEHVAICLNDQEPTLVEEALAKIDKARQIRISLPFVGAILNILQNSSELIGTMPYKVALLYQQQYNIVIKPLPFAMQKIPFYLTWHQRYSNDLGHTWLREEMTRLFKEI